MNPLWLLETASVGIARVVFMLECQSPLPPPPTRRKNEGGRALQLVTIFSKVQIKEIQGSPDSISSSEKQSCDPT